MSIPTLRSMQSQAIPINPKSLPKSHSLKSQSKSGPAIPTTGAPNAQPKSESQASLAIIGGTERLLALFEEEKQKHDALHKVQLLELEARSQKFRAGAEKTQRKLAVRVQELELELASIKYSDTLPLPGGGEGQARMNQEYAKEERVTKPADTARTALMFEDCWSRVQADPAVFAPPDGETVQLLHQLAFHASREVTQGQNGDASGTESNPAAKVGTVPDEFIPALAQYLKSHETALRVWEEKYLVVEEERNSLQKKNREKRCKIRELGKTLFYAQRGGDSVQSGYVRPPDSGSESEEGEDKDVTAKKERNRMERFSLLKTKTTSSSSRNRSPGSHSEDVEGSLVEYGARTKRRRKGSTGPYT